MNLKELFDREFLFESKKDNKLYKIFYRIDINLKKAKKEEQPAPQEVAPQAPAAEVPQPAPQQPIAQTEVPAATEVSQPLPQEVPQAQNLSFSPSVVTEDDSSNETEITDDNSIVRKLNGELEISKEDVDDIQSIDDILDKLKSSNNPQILDELSYEFILNMLQTNQLDDSLKAQLDYKASNLFVEIMYGKKKEESVGFRLIKRKNSDLISNSMLLDNQIVNSPFSKQKLDQKIVDTRNEEYSDD